MKARLQSALPTGGGWLLELKLDGIRAIAVKNGERVQLFSRLPRDLSAEYPHLIEALRKLPAKQLVADGEIVALDEKGHSSFQLLQNRKRETFQSNAIRFYLFDLLNFNGVDLKQEPLFKRRQLLEALLKKATGPLRLSASLDAPVSEVWREVVGRGLEGVIAKQRDSAYEPGRRSGAWLKIKTQTEQEFVIGGYTPPEGTRKYFGSLIMGYYKGHDLIFTSKVGTGFDFATLHSLHQRFQKYRTAACPFANLPTQRVGRFGQGITKSDMAHCVWLRPKLVCQVRFMEWTSDGALRHPVFLGLREDKKAADVVREKPA
jgi:bifunctional non-homologous end joining protein LigD